MAEPGLSLNIGANIDDLEKALKKGEQEIKDFGNKVKKGADLKGLSEGVKAVNPELKKASTGFNDLKNKVSDFASTLINKVKSAANSASNALSQIKAPDAQSKLSGVGDAVEELGDAAGESAGSFLEMGTAIYTGAGLGAIAIGLLKKKVAELVDNYGSLNNALDAYLEGAQNQYKIANLLEQVRKEGNKAGSDEVARLKVLYAVATDVTNTLHNRKEAANELLDVYKEYLPALTQEAVLNNKAADAINNASKALINKELDGAAEKKGGELGEKLLNLTFEQIDAVNKYGSLKNQYDAEELASLERIRKAGKEYIKERRVLNDGTPIDLVKPETAGLLNSARNVMQGLGQDINDTEGQIQALTDAAARFAKLAGDGFIKDQKNGGGSDANTFFAQYKKNLQTAVEDLKNLKKLFEDNNEELTDNYKNTVDLLTATEGRLQQLDLVPIDKIKKIKVEADIDAAIDPGKLEKAKQLLQQQLDKLDKEFRRTRFIEGKIEFTPILELNDKEVLERLNSYKKKLRYYKGKLIEGFENTPTTIEFDDVRRAVETAAKELDGDITIKPKVIVAPEIQAELSSLKEIQSKLGGKTLDIFNALKESIGKAGNAAQLTNAQIADLALRVGQSAAVIQEVFSPVVDSFFESIEAGKNVFQSLGESIKKFVINAIKELIKLAAVAAAITIGSAAAGAPIDFGSAFKIASKGSTLFGGKAAPNFAGVQGGAIAVTVGGQFNVRGTDLVAVVNQGNQRIGRVG